MNENLLIVFYNLSIELSIFMLEFNHLSQYKYYSNVDFITRLAKSLKPYNTKSQMHCAVGV